MATTVAVSGLEHCMMYWTVVRLHFLMETYSFAFWNIVCEWFLGSSIRKESGELIRPIRPARQIKQYSARQQVLGTTFRGPQLNPWKVKGQINDTTIDNTNSARIQWNAQALLYLALAMDSRETNVTENIQPRHNKPKTANNQIGCYYNSSKMDVLLMRPAWEIESWGRSERPRHPGPWREIRLLSTITAVAAHFVPYSQVASTAYKSRTFRWGALVEGRAQNDVISLRMSDVDWKFTIFSDIPIVLHHSSQKVICRGS
jgi:hypothetical protein